MSVWTQFMDMHSGGGQKLDWQYIYIEAPEEEAASVFYARFGRNPHRVTCTCCGEDFSLSESETLEQATAYERGCAYVGNKYVEHSDDRSYRPYRTLDEYIASGECKFIHASEIAADERRRELPSEGYVWQ